MSDDTPDDAARADDADRLATEWLDRLLRRASGGGSRPAPAPSEDDARVRDLAGA